MVRSSDAHGGRGLGEPHLGQGIDSSGNDSARHADMASQRIALESEGFSLGLGSSCSRACGVERKHRGV